ncbi:MAG: TatD family hydrolase [Nitrososphaera sp.]|nr:TatD family hydrolase [Nitrososphaera sp.]
MLVDSHCHLPLCTRAEAPAQLIENATKLDVVHMLCVSVDLESLGQILDLARSYPSVSATVGVHPNSEVAVEPTPDQLTDLANDSSVVAIGETGLDYFRGIGDLEWQRERFRVHIAAARKASKPLVVHSREANADVISILQQENAHEVSGVMHCFIDDYHTARRALDLGFYISFSGIVTFKNAQAVQDVAKKIPLDRLLVETDSPYLAPVPYRGKENQPAYVRYIAECLADLKGISLSRLAEATTKNFFELFKPSVA